MRLVLTALLLSVGVFASASAARQDPGEETGRPGRRQVVVPVSAVDKEGQPVEGLRPEDLRVTVEGQPQNLLSFSKRTEEPRRDGKPLRVRVEVVNPELRRRGVQLAHPQSLFD